MTPDTDVTPVLAASITSWDHEADVVIAGYGVAGAAAAVEAARCGAEVLVLERTGARGGVAAMAGGFIYLGGGTPLQKACGFDDSVDNMAAFLNVAMGPGADENRTADYCAGSVAHFGWLIDCGVPFKAEFFSEPGWEPMGDHGLMYSGGENAYPFNTIASPAPRGHVPQMSNKKQGEASAGYMLMKPLVETATAAGARALYDVRVQRLIVESDGRVVGIRGRKYGGQMTIRARTGVVLATGSFAYNDAMAARFARADRRTPGRVDPTARRAGHPDGAGVGCGSGPHGRHRSRDLHRPSTTGARHPGQWPRSALRHRGHLSRPDRAAHAVPAGQHRVPDHRRRCPGGGDGLVVAQVSC